MENAAQQLENTDVIISTRNDMVFNDPDNEIAENMCFNDTL